MVECLLARNSCQLKLFLSKCSSVCSSVRVYDFNFTFIIVDFFIRAKRGQFARSADWKKSAPLLHPHLNIVYITILLQAVSEKKCFPYRRCLRITQASPSFLVLTKWLISPKSTMHTRVQNMVNKMCSEVNMYKIFSSHLANFSPKKPKKAPWLS